MESLDLAVRAADKFAALGVSVEAAASLAGMSTSIARQILSGLQQNSQRTMSLHKLATDLERLQETVSPVPVNFKRVPEIKKLLALVESNSLRVIVEGQANG